MKGTGEDNDMGTYRHHWSLSRGEARTLDLSMTVNLRTVLRWLDEQRIQDEAECWILSSDSVEPVTAVHTLMEGDVWLDSQSIWGEPAPYPLTYIEVSDSILDSYSGGGVLKWQRQPFQIYRGSYVVDSNKAVFFVFTPESVELIESHAEKMENRKNQAIQLTKDIEESQKWPMSM